MFVLYHFLSSGLREQRVTKDPGALMFTKDLCWLCTLCAKTPFAFGKSKRMFQFDFTNYPVFRRKPKLQNNQIRLI